MRNFIKLVILGIVLLLGGALHSIAQNVPLGSNSTDATNVIAGNLRVVGLGCADSCLIVSIGNGKFVKIPISRLVDAGLYLKQSDSNKYTTKYTHDIWRDQVSETLNFLEDVKIDYQDTTSFSATKAWVLQQLASSPTFDSTHVYAEIESQRLNRWNPNRFRKVIQSDSSFALPPGTITAYATSVYRLRGDTIFAANKADGPDAVNAKRHLHGYMSYDNGNTWGPPDTIITYNFQNLHVRAQDPHLVPDSANGIVRLYYKGVKNGKGQIYLATADFFNPWVWTKRPGEQAVITVTQVKNEFGFVPIDVIPGDVVVRGDSQYMYVTLADSTTGEHMVALFASHNWLNWNSRGLIIRADAPYSLVADPAVYLLNDSIYYMQITQGHAIAHQIGTFVKSMYSTDLYNWRNLESTFALPKNDSSALGSKMYSITWLKTNEPCNCNPDMSLDEDGKPYMHGYISSGYKPTILISDLSFDVKMNPYAYQHDSVSTQAVDMATDQYFIYGEKRFLDDVEVNKLNADTIIADHIQFNTPEFLTPTDTVGMLDNVIKQGGNSFAAPVAVGSNNAQATQLKVNGRTALNISTGGLFSFGYPDTPNTYVFYGERGSSIILADTPKMANTGADIVTTYLMPIVWTTKNNSGAFIGNIIRWYAAYNGNGTNIHNGFAGLALNQGNSPDSIVDFMPNVVQFKDAVTVGLPRFYKDSVMTNTLTTASLAILNTPVGAISDSILVKNGIQVRAIPSALLAKQAALDDSMADLRASSSAPNLQAVTNAGSAATNPITTTGYRATASAYNQANLMQFHSVYGNMINGQLGSLYQFGVINAAGEDVMKLNAAGTGLIVDKTTTFSLPIVVSIQEYADNAAAVGAGLLVGQMYRTGDILKVVH